MTVGSVKLDKAAEFLIKIQTKNQLKHSLKIKKEEYSKLIQHPEFVDECNLLQNEIKVIEYELSKYD